MEQSKDPRQTLEYKVELEQRIKRAADRINAVLVEEELTLIGTFDYKLTNIGIKQQFVDARKTDGKEELNRKGRRSKKS